jgi:hypothetical protein
VDEAAVVENATRAWDMAFYAMPFKAGDRILTAHAEYASKVIAFLQVAVHTGAVVEVVGPADDPEVAACVAVARAWLAGPGKGAPDLELASAAVAATRATADPVLISSGLCAAGTAALYAGRLREANRITRERLLLPSMDRNDPYCAPEICNTYGRACVYAIMTGDLPGAMAAARAGIDDDLLCDTHITASRLVQPLVLTGRFRDAIGYAERMWDQ